MFIKRIQLENIKRYENVDITFSKGLNFISGKNGAGKTTIIESIGYAIFGFQNASKGFASYIIRKGEKKGSIRVTFLDKDDNELIADRKISQSSAGNSWSIRKMTDSGEVEIVSGTVEVPSYLHDHLEFYPDDDISQIFEKIISVPQGEMTAAFFGTEKSRKEEFDPLFKLDTYRKSFERIKLVRDIENENIQIDKEVQKMLGEISLEESLSNEKKEKKNLIKDAKDELLKYTENKKGIEEEYNAQVKLKDEIEKDNNEYKLKIAESEKYVALAKQNNAALETIEKAIDILNKSKDKYEEYKKEEINIQKYEENMKALEPIIQEETKLNERITNGRAKVEERKKQIEERKIEIDKLSKNIEEESKKLEELKKELNNEKESNISKNNDEKEKQKENEEKLLNFAKDSEEKIIEYTIKLEGIKKELKDSLMKQTKPNREIVYLNAASSNIDVIIDKTDNEVKSAALNAKENLTKAIEISKEENSLFDPNVLIEEKEKIELEINDIMLKLIVSDVDKKRYDQEGITCARTIIKEIIKNLEDSKKEDQDNMRKIELEIESIKKLLQIYKNDQEEKIKKNVQEQEDVKKWQDAINGFIEKVNKLAPDIKNIDNIKKMQEVSKAKMKEAKAAYDAYIQNSKKKDEKEEALKLKKEYYDKISEYEIVIKKLEEALNKKKEAFNIDTYNKVKNSHDNLEKNVGLITENIKHLEKRIDDITKILDHYKEIKVQIKAKKKEMQDNQKAIEILKKLKKVINAAPEKIANMLIKNISNKASMIYSDIASDTSRLEWENSYELSLYDYIDGKEIKKEFKQLSGGEQMTAALAIRIAMLELLTRLKIGILDEPTTNIDSLRREKLAEKIGEVTENFTQLFVVSHDDTFENITQNVVSLTRNE